MNKLIAGNWKMNCDRVSAQVLVADVVKGDIPGNVDVCFCPPFVYISDVVGDDFPKNIFFVWQDCSYYGENGAYTGDVSASMLKDLGCEYVILGHSERRQYHVESNNIISKKVEHAIKAGLKVIVCVGETEKERQEGLQNPVVIMQLKESIPEGVGGENLVIAYEPVWAIGTGKTATAQDVQEMHGVIRRYVQEKLDKPDLVRILYGGSVKPENAAELLQIENVDGALVGGASLKVDQFLAIIAAAK